MNTNIPRLSVSDILDILAKEGIDAETEGDLAFEVKHLRNIERADPYSLTFFVGGESSELAKLRKCVVLTHPKVFPSDESVVCIQTEHPKLAFYILAQQFQPHRRYPGIHETAVIDEKSRIHPSAYIGPYCVIEESIVGAGAVLEAHITLMRNTQLGSNVTVEPNTCIGATGQIWAWGLDGKCWVMPQLGGTTVGDSTFIGSNITIVKGALQDTVIGANCRIAHGSRIGHNSSIGKGSFISNQVAIPGSVNIGEDCFLGSGAVFRAGVTLGNFITVGAGSVVTKNFDQPGAVLTGVPARITKTIELGSKLAGVPHRVRLEDN